MNSIEREHTTFQALQKIKRYLSSLPMNDRYDNRHDAFIAECLEADNRSETELLDALCFCTMLKSEEEEHWYVERAIKVLMDTYSCRNIAPPLYFDLVSVYQYLKARNYTSGIITTSMSKLVREKLHIAARSNTELQEMRDMAVLMADQASEKQMDKHYDCMNAITSVIDQEQFNRGMEV